MHYLFYLANENIMIFSTLLSHLLINSLSFSLFVCRSLSFFFLPRWSSSLFFFLTIIFLTIKAHQIKIYCCAHCSNTVVVHAHNHSPIAKKQQQQHRYLSMADPNGSGQGPCMAHGPSKNFEFFSLMYSFSNFCKK